MTLTYDLFAGAGGASLGLKAAGHDVHGFEFWPLACETHRLNVGPCLEVDLNDIPWEMFRRPDFLWASPPCQPFSAAGLGLADMDPRDGTPAFLRAVRILRPPVVVMENVKGLTYKRHRAYLDLILAELGELGYVVDHRVLNCADYGVPQTRQRLFIIARRDGMPKWPVPTHAQVTDPPNRLAPWLSMAEALGWTEAPHWRTWRGSGMKERHGERPYHDPAEGPAPTIAANTYRTLEWAMIRPARTVGTTFGGVAGKQKGGHLNLTVAEAAILQGFPVRAWSAGRTSGASAGVRPRDPSTEPAATITAIGNAYWERADGSGQFMRPIEGQLLQSFPEGFRFLGTKTEQFRQIGNAVPPVMAKLIAEANA